MEDKIYLENLVISLQKTFSRVNQATGENQELRPETPTARITGDINFTISTKAIPEVGDRILIAKEGHVELSFQGTIDMDVDTETVGEETEGEETENLEENG